jgi:hypothetical protein
MKLKWHTTSPACCITVFADCPSDHVTDDSVVGARQSRLRSRQASLCARPVVNVGIRVNCRGGCLNTIILPDYHRVDGGRADSSTQHCLARQLPRQQPILWSCVRRKPNASVFDPVVQILLERLRLPRAGLIIVAKLIATAIANFIRGLAEILNIGWRKTSHEHVLLNRLVSPCAKALIPTTWARVKFHDDLIVWSAQ